MTFREGLLVLSFVSWGTSILIDIFSDNIEINMLKSIRMRQTAILSALFYIIAGL